MPWLHRLACFRDDVVFCILIYQVRLSLKTETQPQSLKCEVESALTTQRWIYRVDYSRVNEYGQVVEGKVEPVGDKDKAEAITEKETKETKKTK